MTNVGRDNRLPQNTALARDGQGATRTGNGPSTKTDGGTPIVGGGFGAPVAGGGAPIVGGGFGAPVDGGGLLGGAAPAGGLFGGQAKPLPAPGETAAYKAMSPDLQAQVRDLARKGTKFSTPMLSGILQQPAFRGMSPADQKKMLDVYGASDDQGRFELSFAGNRTLPDGKPALLDRDSTGRTTLDQLHQLATGPIDPKFAANHVSRNELLTSAIQEIGRPGEINQHSKGTCTVTSVSYALAQRNPAEYARLVTGLASPGGEVKMRNGEVLKRNETGIAPDTATGRSPTERLLQSSLMEYGNGALYTYDNNKDEHSGIAGPLTRVVSGWGQILGVNGGTSGHGLADVGTRDVYNAVFGANARVIKSDAGGRAIADLANVKPNEAMLSIKWGSGGHEVTFDRLEGDRVYFRNPWGGRFVPPGETLGDPPRRLEDPFTGMESMSVADARKYFKAVIRE